jgi:hypothetical protein
VSSVWRHGRSWGALVGVAALAGACPALAAARPLLLPSPVQPLDSKVPLPPTGPASQLQLPLNARLESHERVLVRTLPDGRVVGLRVVQRLTLTGTGDYFLSVPAPLLDARSAPGSQAEPGFRRSGILWQGFSNRRRVLAADAVLDPDPASAALPLRVELDATVDGQQLTGKERRSGRLRLELRLRNTTAVRVPVASARAVKPGEARRIAVRVASQLRRGEVPEQPALEVDGPVKTRELTVDAPLVVAGTLRLRARSVRGEVVRGGSLVRRAGEAVVRFRLLLAGPERPNTTIVLSGSVAEAAAPEALLTAEPSAAAVVSGVTSTDEASRFLLELARVRQYDAFLANPAPGGSVDAVYRFHAADAPAPTAAAPASDGDSGVLPVLVVVAALAGAGGLVVLWARL